MTYNETVQDFRTEVSAIVKSYPDKAIEASKEDAHKAGRIGFAYHPYIFDECESATEEMPEGFFSDLHEFGDLTPKTATRFDTLFDWFGQENCSDNRDVFVPSDYVLLEQAAARAEVAQTLERAAARTVLTELAKAGAVREAKKAARKKQAERREAAKATRKVRVSEGQVVRARADWTQVLALARRMSPEETEAFIAANRAASMERAERRMVESSSKKRQAKQRSLGEEALTRRQEAGKFVDRLVDATIGRQQRRYFRIKSRMWFTREAA